MTHRCCEPHAFARWTTLVSPPVNSPGRRRPRHRHREDHGQRETKSSGIYYPPVAYGTALRASVPIQTGSQPVNVQVTVIYSLAN